MRKVLRLAAIIVGWALTVAVALAIWLHYSASRGDLTLYLTSAVPFAVIPGVLAVVLFCTARSWIPLIPTVAVILGLLWTQAPLFRAQTAPAAHQFVVASSNLMKGEGSVDAVLAQVRSRKVDVLSVQELTPEALARLRAAGIERDLPYSYVVPAALASGTGLFSRHPLSQSRKIDTMLMANLVALVDLPGIGPTWFGAVHSIAPLRGNAALWTFELSELARVLHELPGGRAIAAGDFNATWDHVQYRDILKQGFADAAEQSGAGLLFTYPTDRWGHRPFLALDHVVARGFVADEIIKFDIDGSDHRGVVATLGTS